jgi:hypothetical protein
MRRWPASFIGTDVHLHSWPKDSALFAVSSPSGRYVSFLAILRLNFKSFKATRIVVVEACPRR